VSEPGLQRGWWLEDARPGGVIEHPGGRTIGADEHPRLAMLTNNASDVHNDAARATSGAFGAPVVMGALTAAVVIGLAEPAVGPAENARRALQSAWSQIALTAIVTGGATLKARSFVESVEPDTDGRGGLVGRVVEGRDQHGTVVVRIRERRWVPSRPI